MTGGVCNLKTFDVTLSTKLNANNPLQDKKRDAYILPHEKIYDSFSKLNIYAQSYLPMRHYNTPNDKYIEYEDIVKYINLRRLV